MKKNILSTLFLFLNLPIRQAGFNLIFILFLSLNLLLNLSCSTTDPKLEPDLALKLEDVSCTEAWLQLTTNNIQLPATINILKNNSVTQTFSLSTQDSLLYIDSLLPNQNYSFQVSSTQNPVSSNELNVTTLDTTSHNFTWQTFTFGEHSSSVLFDVAIIDENNIWVVGEIFMNDSLGNPDPNAYNAVHWNGQNWELKRIGGIGGWACHTVFAFSANDIWFEGNIHWDGSKYTVYKNGWPLMPNGDGWQVNKMWGSSSEDLYAVGNNGNIAHWDGKKWTKIESGTDTDFKDIYGTPDGKEIWTCGWTNRNGRVAIVKIKESGEVESIWDSQTNREFSYYYNEQLLNTLWANGNGEFVFATGVVTRHSLLDKRILRFDWVPYLNGQQVLHLGNYAYRIRGSKKNNIAVAGDEAMIWHYNGATWHKFEELQYFDDRLYSLAVTYNLIIAVGKRYSGLTSGALLLVGRR